MARLLRLHLASVGHTDARFSPLKLDFRGPNGLAANTVLWLRNGGGKSSLLNLFYSTFVPQTKHFLGKRSDGRSRQLGDYVQGRDLACVVSEWEMAASPNQPSDIRIIGQVISWKDAVQALHDESRLERCFFTFRSGSGIGFDSVPLFGLGAPPSLSLDQFRNWLNWLKGEHRSLETESRSQSQKGDWQRVLRDVGFDEELFQYQLIMNGREGGADELFRVRSADEFINLFLEIAYPPSHANETARTLMGVREKLLKLPHHQLEECFVLDLSGALRPLESAVREQENASVELLLQKKQNFLIHAAIADSLVKMDRSFKNLETEITEIKQEEDGHKLHKAKLQEHRLNYEYLANDLAFTEAETEYQSALKDKEGADHNHKVLVAAEALDSLHQQEHHLDGLKKTQAELFVKQQPEIEELNQKGSIYLTALDLLLKTAKDELEAAKESQSKITEKKRQTENEFNLTLTETTKARSEYEGIEEKLRRRDQQRAALRNGNWLEDREKVSAAILRWEKEEVHRNQLALKNEEDAQESEHLAAEERIAAQTADTNQREHQLKFAELDALVQRGRVQHQELLGDAYLREAAVSDAPDLDFPPLPELLRQKEKNCLNRIIETRLDAVDDERAAKYQETEHLLPPTLDVERALTWLKAQNVFTAMPAYRFLSQNDRGIESAMERIRQDPARYSGIMLNNPEEFQRFLGRRLEVPGLRHPVAITLTGFTEISDKLPETIVLMPETAGGFNQAAASASIGGVQNRLEQAANAIHTLEEERAGTQSAFKKLLDFQSEFGAGNLSRLEMSCRHENEGMLDWKGRAEEHHEKALTYQAKAGELRNHATSIRRELPNLAAGLQRLSGYVFEYERYEDTWLEQRIELQQRIEELTRSGEELAQLKKDFEIAQKTAIEAIVGHRNKLAELDRERTGIRYFIEGKATDILPLENARTQYRSLLDAFERRYGTEAISGQIKEAEETRGKLEGQYIRQRDLLAHEEIVAFLGSGVLSERKAQIDEHRLQAHSRINQASSTLEKARLARKPRAHKQGDALLLGSTSPKTSAEARVKEKELASEIEKVAFAFEEAQSRLSIKKEEIARLETDLEARRPLIELLASYIEPAGGSQPVLPEEREAVKKLATDAKQVTEQLVLACQNAVKAVDRLLDQLLAIPRHENYALLASTAREKLPSLQKSELLARCGELRAGYEERQKVLRSEIDSFTKDKEIVVQQLYNVAREAISLLSQAERASVLPESMSGWADQPFLRIRSAPVPESIACRERLGLLVGRMVAEKAIPDGHELAFAAVREIAAPFKVTLLKPELVLSPHRHDIVEFGNFSDGERLTAAILLYSSLAQLRRRSREGDRRSHEAGILILDNPFGKASLRDFVEIQIRVASQMGVQLIYATGINDLGALEVFPRIIRLRNIHRDRRSGDKVVTEDRDSIESAVETASANLRP